MYTAPEEKIKMKKAEIAKKIDRLFTKHLGDIGDYRIYYNNKAIEVKASRGRKIIEGIKATDYCKYGSDDTITVAFDGTLYELMNYGLHVDLREFGIDKVYNDHSLQDELNELLEKYNCYYETGNAWNFNIYQN